jgi:hypothetical protein
MVIRRCLEIQLDSHSPSIRFRRNELISNDAAITDWSRLSPRMNVIENALAMGIGVPVESQRHVVHFTTLYLIVS